MSNTYKMSMTTLQVLEFVVSKSTQKSKYLKKKASLFLQMGKQFHQT